MSKDREQRTSGPESSLSVYRGGSKGVTTPDRPLRRPTPVVRAVTRARVAQAAAVPANPIRATARDRVA